MIYKTITGIEFKKPFDAVQWAMSYGEKHSVGIYKGDKFLRWLV